MTSPAAVAHLLDDVGDEHVAAVGDRRRDERHLQRRRGDVALADAEVVGVTEVPGLADRLFLPLRVRHEALDSPGRSMPVASPRPKRRVQSASLRGAEALEDGRGRPARSRRRGSRSRRRTTWRRRGRSSACPSAAQSRKGYFDVRVELVLDVEDAEAGDLGAGVRDAFLQGCEAGDLLEGPARARTAR